MDNITHENSKDNFRALMELLKPEGFRRVCRALEHEIGTAEASLYAELLGRFEYFQDRGQLDDDGYFFNTVLDLQRGTALSDKRQRSTITRLEKLQLIKTKLKGVPPKRYFKIVDNEEQLLKYLKNGKVKMDTLKEQANKQKNKVEDDRLNKEGCFNPKYKRISKSANMEDLNLPIKQTNKNKTNKNKEAEASNPAAPVNNSKSKQVVKEYISLLKGKNLLPVINESKLIKQYSLSPLVELEADQVVKMMQAWFKTADDKTVKEGFPFGYFIKDYNAIEKPPRVWLSTCLECYRQIYDDEAHICRHLAICDKCNVGIRYTGAKRDDEILAQHECAKEA